MTEPTERDIVDKILDRLCSNLTTALTTNVATADAARVKSVTIGPIADDKEEYSPYVEVYHDDEHLDRDWHKGGSFMILRLVGGGGVWLHHFKIVVSDLMVGGGTTRAIATDRHAALRYRVKKALLDEPNLDGAEDSFGAKVDANCDNDVILYYATESRGGEDEWIWRTTYFVKYRVDQP